MTALLVVATMMAVYLEFGYPFHDPEWVTAPLNDLYSDLTEYTLYEDEVTWNDAARICALDGGHILSINSQEKYDLIEEFKQNEWSSIQDKEYWSGLSEPSMGVMIWEDCTEMSPTFNMLKGESFNSDELCYKVLQNSHVWESKKCSDKEYFACEKIIPGACDHSTILSSNKVATYSNMSTADCQSSCALSSTCWSGISTVTGLCILLESRAGSESLGEVTMFKKICVRVSFVDNANVPTLPYEDKDLQPLLNCSGIQQPTPTSVTEASDITPSIEPTSSFQISPTPCFLYETVNITNIFNATDFINVTSMINHTQTVSITETLYATMSVDLIHTINITETINETIYFTVTSTQIDQIASTIGVTETINVNVTSTVYDSVCPSGVINRTYTYLSTDDPFLLEAIASMTRELTLDKKDTNSHIRTLTSAPDYRTSARVIGSTGLVLLIIPVVIIVLADIPAVVRRSKLMFQRYRNSERYATQGDRST